MTCAIPESYLARSALLCHVLYVDYSGFYGDSRSLSDNCDSCNRCSIPGHLTRFRCIRLACKSRFPIHYTTFKSSAQVRSRFNIWWYVSRTCRVRVGEDTDYIYRVQNTYVTRVLLCHIIFRRTASPLLAKAVIIRVQKLHQLYLPHTLRIGAGAGFVLTLVF
jgi:hypothetical protein